LVNFFQTKGLSLEEINGKFGDNVIVHLTDGIGKQLDNSDLEGNMLTDEEKDSASRIEG
jgi:hypothetical protein